jgi:hypothetical protein
MILQSLSDAFYLCRPRARSVYGCFNYLGDRNAIYGSISFESWMISCVVASVAETELTGGFRAAQMSVQHCRILHDLGYPQPPTLLRMDNIMAIGLAQGFLNAKRSKSMDMRFFWLIDRVAQNIADHCFHKTTLPKGNCYQFFPYLAVNMDNENNAATSQKSINHCKAQ